MASRSRAPPRRIPAAAGSARAETTTRRTRPRTAWRTREPAWWASRRNCRERTPDLWPAARPSLRRKGPPCRGSRRARSAPRRRATSPARWATGPRMSGRTAPGRPRWAARLSRRRRAVSRPPVAVRTASTRRRRPAAPPRRSRWGAGGGAERRSAAEPGGARRWGVAGRGEWSSLSWRTCPGTNRHRCKNKKATAWSLRWWPLGTPNRSPCG